MGEYQETTSALARRARHEDVPSSWLRRDLAATLATVASAVSVPPPKWQFLHTRVTAGRSCRPGRWRLPALAGSAAAICLTLLAPTVGATVVAHALSPEALAARAPATAALHDGYATSTPTPVACVQSGGGTAPVTPVPELPPTPPHVERTLLTETVRP